MEEKERMGMKGYAEKETVRMTGSDETERVGMKGGVDKQRQQVINCSSS